MSLRKKIDKYRGGTVIVELDDGRFIKGILKGVTWVENALEYDAILIASGDKSTPESIPLEIIVDIRP